MMRKWMSLAICFTILFALFQPHTAEAAKRPSYKSPKSTYQQPAPKAKDSVNETRTGTGTTTGTKTPASGSTTSQTGRGFFSGGLAKGLFLGGMAGLLFGSMFGGMGFLGNMLGFMVNVLAVVFLIALVRGIFTYFKNRRRYNEKRY